MDLCVFFFYLILLFFFFIAIIISIFNIEKYFNNDKEPQILKMLYDIKFVYK